MKFRNCLSMILPMLLLHLFTGCSDNSGEGIENLIPVSGSVGNEVVLYEANPRVFAQSNALAAITTGQSARVCTREIAPGGGKSSGLHSGIGNKRCVVYATQ